MTIISNMQIKLNPGVRAAAVETFKNHRVFQDCAQAIPGFLWARLLEPDTDPDAIAVISEWSDKAAYDAWVSHPVRASQEAALVQFVAEPPQTQLYASKADFERMSASI